MDIEFFLTMLVIALAGAIFGVGKLLARDFPKICDFIKNRPVLGWTAAFLAWGLALYGILYLSLVLILELTSIVLKH